MDTMSPRTISLHGYLAPGDHAALKPSASGLPADLK